MTVTIALANQKGGVGKTTTAYNLARAAHTHQIKTLVIDMDPQGNLTSALAAEPLAEDRPGVADALHSRAPEQLSDVLVETAWSQVTLAPTVGEALAFVRDEMVIAGAGRESRLLEALAPLKDQYELILIDCAPSLDLLTLNAMTAADQVLVITHPAQWSSNGLARLLETIGNVSRFYNPALGVAGVVINHFEKQTLNDAHWRREIEAAITERGLRMIYPPIPKRAVIKAAAEAGVGLDEWSSTEAHHLHQTYARILDTIRA